MEVSTAQRSVKSPKEDSGELSIPGHCNGRCKPRTRGGGRGWKARIAGAADNIYSCFEKKDGGISVSSAGTLLFRAQRGCFLLPYSIPLVCLSHSFPSRAPSDAALRGAFLSAESTVGRSSQQSSQSNPFRARLESERTIRKERGIRGNA